MTQRPPADDWPMLDDETCEVWSAWGHQMRPWHLDLLDVTERRRRAALTVPADRDGFTVGCLIQRLVLSRYLIERPRAVPLDRDCVDASGRHAQPAVTARAGIDISVAYSGDRIAVAFARSARVGVDVREIRPVDDDVLALILAETEATRFATVGPQHRTRELFTYWSRKESVIKAIEGGPRPALTDVEVSPPGEAARLLACRGRPNLARTATVSDLRPVERYVGAVTTVSARPTRVFERDAAALLLPGTGPTGPAG